MRSLRSFPTLRVCAGLLFACAMPLTAQDQAAADTGVRAEPTAAEAAAPSIVILAAPLTPASQDMPVLRSASRAQTLALAHTALATGGGLALLSYGMESDLAGIAGYWLFFYGVTVAPSVGNLYASDFQRTQQGILIRSVGGLLVTASFFRQLLTEWDLDDESTLTLRWDRLNSVGAAVMFAGTLYSFGTISRSVAEHNDRRTGAARRATFSAHPTFEPATGAVGLGVGVRF